MEIKLNSSKLQFKVDGKKVLQNFLDFNLGSAVTEILNVDSSIEAKAFSLLFNVARQTNVELSKRLGQDKIDKAINLKIIFDDFEVEWIEYFEQEITITKDFFENILEYNPAYLTKSYKLFERYLEILEIGLPNEFYYTYYVSFRENLFDEYNANKDKYEQLTLFFNNPISVENDKLRHQIDRYVEISKYYIMPLQHDVAEALETLKDLYIEPNFKVFKRNLLNKGEAYGEDFVNVLPELTIHEYLNNFFLKGQNPSENFRENYNMIFILGQPGQGKTSFCYKLIHDILKDSLGLPETPLYFLKIRDLHAKDFINDTFSTINNAIGQNLDFGKDKCTLILDGLDEAYMSGGLSDKDLKNLYERLNKTSKSNRNLKIILTSRLNYLSIEDPSLEGTLVVKLDFLSDEQIIQYVNKFIGFYPQNLLFSKIDKLLKQEEFLHIKELLQQPVLIYFIALSNIDLEKGDSKAHIYNKIFDSLAIRSWDKRGQLDYIKVELKDNPQKYSKYLRQYIRSLAFEIYQSPNLHITLKTLLNLDSTRQFIKRCFNDDIASDSDRIKDVSKYLLISFYFQQSNKNQEEDTAIEFFHNSLYEFLTAEYLWEENKRILLNEDQDGELKTLRFEEYFEVLQKLIGNKELKFEVKNNLENIIQIEDYLINKKIFEQTNDVFFKLVEKDILLFYDWRNEALSPRSKMNNIFELIWTFINRSAIEINERIVTNERVNEYFFGSQLNLTHRQLIKNIDFREDTFVSFYINECTILNVSFELTFTDVFYFFRNEIENCSFFYLYMNDTFHHNNCENVIFENVKFGSSLNFINNTLKNCKFINVGVPSKGWLDKLIKNNKFDKEFEKNHVIRQKKIDYGDGVRSDMNFYITYIGDVNE